MTEGAAGERRTRRRRAARAAPTTTDPGESRPDAAAAQPTGREPRRRSPGAQKSAERALRDLAGATPSQVGVQGALRARDVNRPSAAELAAAEREVTIVRRHWRPDPDGQPDGR